MKRDRLGRSPEAAGSAYLREPRSDTRGVFAVSAAVPPAGDLPETAEHGSHCRCPFPLCCTHIPLLLFIVAMSMDEAVLQDLPESGVDVLHLSSPFLLFIVMSMDEAVLQDLPESGVDVLHLSSPFLLFIV